MLKFAKTNRKFKNVKIYGLNNHTAPVLDNNVFYADLFLSDTQHSKRNWLLQIFQWGEPKSTVWALDMIPKSIFRRGLLEKSRLALKGKLLDY